MASMDPEYGYLQEDLPNPYLYDLDLDLDLDIESPAIWDPSAILSSPTLTDTDTSIHAHSPPSKLSAPITCLLAPATPPATTDSEAESCFEVKHEPPSPHGAIQPPPHGEKSRGQPYVGKILGGAESSLERRQRRLIKNRESACQSRRRKKEELSRMEQTMNEVTQANAELRINLDILREENARLLTDLQWLRELAMTHPPFAQAIAEREATQPLPSPPMFLTLPPTTTPTPTHTHTPPPSSPTARPLAGTRGKVKAVTSAFLMVAVLCLHVLLAPFGPTQPLSLQTAPTVHTGRVLQWLQPPNTQTVWLGDEPAVPHNADHTPGADLRLAEAPPTDPPTRYLVCRSPTPHPDPPSPNNPLVLLVDEPGRVGWHVRANVVSARPATWGAPQLGPGMVAVKGGRTWAV